MSYFSGSIVALAAIIFFLPSIVFVFLSFLPSLIVIAGSLSFKKSFVFLLNSFQYSVCVCPNNSNFPTNLKKLHNYLLLSQSLLMFILKIFFTPQNRTDVTQKKKKKEKKKVCIPNRQNSPCSAHSPLLTKKRTHSPYPYTIGPDT